MGVVWGLPVDPAKLGAHLEAYVDMKPTIDALRLCNRFGGGPEAYITHLPQELVSMIELELVRKLRIHYYHSHWGNELRCLEQHCDLEDHFDEEEMQEIKIRAANELNLTETDWVQNDRTEYLDYIEDQVYQTIVGSERVERKHFLKTRHWMGRFDLYGGHFNVLESTLASDFGLHAVISHHRIPNNQRELRDYAAGSDHPAETTICYLTLPAIVATEDNRDGVDTEQTNVFRDSTMSAFLDITSLTITDKQSARFGRAMQILGLKPCIHFTQLSNTLAAVSTAGSERHLLTRNPKQKSLRRFYEELYYEENQESVAKAKERAKKLENSQWPRLVVFASNHHPSI